MTTGRRAGTARPTKASAAVSARALPGQVSELAMELSIAMIRLRSRLRTEQVSVAAGLSLSQLSALGRVAELAPVTATALARAEHLRQQSISETLAVLRTGGYVAGHPDATDKRKTLFSLTPAGRRIVESIYELRGSWIADAIAHCASADDRDTLAAAVQIMHRLAEWTPAST